MFMSYLLFIFGFASADDEEAVFAGGLIGIAMGLVPLAFIAAAAASRRERSVRAVLLATLLFGVVGLPIAILDIPTGLVAGFGAGGIVALRRVPATSIGHRIGAIATCVVYVFVVRLVLPVAGLMVGAIVPFAAIALSDLIRERQLAE